MGAVAAAVAVAAVVRAAFAAGAPALGATLAAGFVASAALTARDVRRARLGTATRAIAGATALLLLMLGARLA